MFSVHEIVSRENISCSMEKNTSRGSPLVKLREEKGLTQRQLAEAIGVSERTVINWENGHRIPRLTVDQMKALCQVLELPIESLPSKFGPEAN